MIEQWMLDQLTVVDGELHRKGKGTDRIKPKPRGYVYLTFYKDGKKTDHLVHRLLFTKVMGYEPEFVDHIDGNRSHNRMSNLRECTRAENNRNARRAKHNTSGWKGVSYYTRLKKWRAEVMTDGKKQTALFNCPTAAFLGSMRMRAKHGEFTNHGD